MVFDTIYCINYVLNIRVVLCLIFYFFVWHSTMYNSMNKSYIFGIRFYFGDLCLIFDGNALCMVFKFFCLEFDSLYLKFDGNKLHLVFDGNTLCLVFDLYVFCFNFDICMYVCINVNVYICMYIYMVLL